MAKYRNQLAVQPLFAFGRCHVHLVCRPSCSDSLRRIACAVLVRFCSVGLTRAVEWTPGAPSACISCGAGPAPLTAIVRATTMLKWIPFLLVLLVGCSTPKQP